MRRITRTSAFILFLCLLCPAETLRGDEQALRRLSSDLLERSRSARREALAAARSRGLAVSGVDSNRREFSLQRLGPGGIPVYYMTENLRAAITTGTNDVWAEIGGGAGFEFGIWDAGKVGTTHADFGYRAVWTDAVNPDLSNHATHVAGTLIGSGSTSGGARGMSWEAGLVCYYNDDDIAEMAAEAAGGMILSNHSYGHIQGWYYGDLHDDGVTEYRYYWYGNTLVSTTEDYRFGSYSGISEQVDSIAAEAPGYLIVTSAGNHRGETVPAQGDSHYVWNQYGGYWEWSNAVRDIDGGTDRYESLGDGWKTAKNSLTVGGVEDIDGYTGTGDVVIIDGSSWGPTDDGRIKPDLVGNGDQLLSTIGINWGHDRYSGTSMAAANVAGSLALLQDWHIDNHGGVPMKAATLKALAICTALEAGIFPGPDYMFGWGLLDAKGAFDLLEDDLSRGGLVRELTVNEDTPIALHYRTTSSQPRATICWTDPPGASTGTALNPAGLQLVNDLEVMLERGAAFHYPWTLDPSDPDRWAERGTNSRDNVERVDISNAGVGDRYTIWIWENGDLAGGSQDVSLVVRGMQPITTWYVSASGGADFGTIGAALSIASAGDTIIVYEGTYEEHDLTIDKQLVISAPDGPETTVVDAQGLGRCLFVDGAAGAAEISGFTLRNGDASGAGIDGYGGAVYCASGGASISGCRIEGSSSSVRGGGIYLTSGTPAIAGCEISGCSSAGGGGIYAYYCDPVITGTHISDCIAANYGGGIYCYHADASLDHCLLDGDDAGTSGGGLCAYESAPSLTGCTFTGCGAGSRGGGVYASTNGYPVLTNTMVVFSTGGEGVYGTTGFSGATVTCCDVYGNAGGNYGGSISNRTGIDGNISADPLFCDAAASNYGLQGISPCLPGNNSCGVQIGYLGQNCHSRSLWYVNAAGTGDAPTIQAAIDSTFDGDTVMVAAGTYTGTGNRDIEFRGKRILVVAESGRDLTTIDCQSAYGDNHAGFIFDSGEDSTSVLEGFTVTGASRGGVRTSYASPVIRDCRFTYNEAVQYSLGPGGGMYLVGGHPGVTGCEITYNGGPDGIGGVYAENSRLHIEGCAITDNIGAFGGLDVNLDAALSAVIRDCTISRNYGVDAGGAVRATGWGSLTIEDCRIFDNTSEDAGGAIAINGGLTMTGTIVARNASTGNPPQNRGGGLVAGGATFISGCTFVLNEAPNTGAGIYLGQQSPERPVTISRTIVAFNHGSDGIHLNDPVGGSDVTVSCSDVYGNDAGDYGGDLPDQTGTGWNISEDPLLCDTLAGSFYIFDDSPCAPAHSPCGALIGCRQVACFEAPDLVVTGYSVSDHHPDPGEGITFTFTVRNDGVSEADTCTLGWYRDRSTMPLPGSAPTMDTLVTALAPGDSVVWTTSPVTSTQFGEWSSWLLADAGGAIRERDEEDNDAGPIAVTWGVSAEPGWPVAGSDDFISAPLAERLDDDPADLETVAGDASGVLHAWNAGGTRLAGWPVALGDSILAAPSAGDITGDFHPEIVVGTVDGYLHAVSADGTKLWSVDTEFRINRAATLADLDLDGYLEIVLPSWSAKTGGAVRVFEGDGSEWSGAWPVKIGGPGGITEAAAGDVDGDGHTEIAVVTWGYTSPGVHSMVNLIADDGSSYGTGWPVMIDTVIVAPPVIGDIAGGSPGMEIVAGAISGEVFAINLSGTVWPSVPRMPGMIESSPILVQVDKDPEQEIVVTARFWYEPYPPFGSWQGRLVIIDGDGTMPSSWRKSLGSWSNDYGPVPSPVSFGGTITSAGPTYRVYSWWDDTSEVEAFPVQCGGRVVASPCAVDVEGDGVIEMTVPSTDDSIYCFELRGAGYDAGEADWPMYRHDARRTGCWYLEPVTGDDHAEETPSVTGLASVYPNPFNPTTTIRFSLRTRSGVRISIYDVAGRLVRTVQDGPMEAGWHTVRWDGTSTGGSAAASGVYFCRMTAGDVDETRKMVLLR